MFVEQVICKNSQWSKPEKLNSVYKVNADKSYDVHHPPLKNTCILVITTDGMENASREYSSEKVKQMIRRQEERYGWEFLFVAANIDAVETAEHIGIRRERAANYRHDSKGTETLYSAMSATVANYRKNARVADNWADELNKEEEK